MLMPLSASIIGRTLLLPYDEVLGKHLFLGLVSDDVAVSKC
jgi:hypothetical protein